MSTLNDIRRLQIALPVCPKALSQLQVLLKDPETHVQTCADVIASDMGLAAEVVRTVNAAMFGLLRRVDHIGEALRFLGTDQVAAITLQAALRRAFPPTDLLQLIWDQAAQLGWVMGKAAALLDLDPWLAHSAGLFARSGSAVFATRNDLFPAGYAALHDPYAHDPHALATVEIAAIGVGHHAVGSALCAQWGLSNQVVRYVQARAMPTQTWVHVDLPVRRLLVLGCMVEQIQSTGHLVELPADLSGLAGWPGERLPSVLEPIWAQVTRRPSSAH